MNAKPNYIELMPAVLSSTRTRGLLDFTKRAIPVAWAPPVIFEVEPPQSQLVPRLGSLSLDHSARDACETLSFAVLWLCGLIGVALCFLGIARF